MQVVLTLQRRIRATYSVMDADPSGSELVFPDPDLSGSELVLPDPDPSGSELVLPDPDPSGSEIVLPDPDLSGSKLVLPDPDRKLSLKAYESHKSLVYVKICLSLNGLFQVSFQFF